MVESIKEDIENDALGPVLVAQGEARFNDLCMMHGCVEGALKISKSAFVSKIPRESSHSVKHGENQEHIVLGLVRFGVARERLRTRY